MPETTEEKEMSSFADLDAVLSDQQKTIDTLTGQLKTESSGSSTIFNTSPTAPEKPKNFVFFIAIGVIIFLLMRGK